jgi:hypothetical protein
MVFADLLQKWSHQHVTIIGASTSWDEYGNPIAGTTTTLTALVQYNTRAAIDREGKQKVSSCQILLSPDTMITIDDKITLPDGTTPIILSIEKTVDFDGNLEYIKVYT